MGRRRRTCPLGYGQYPVRNANSTKDMDVDKRAAKSDLDRLESEAKEKALRAKVMRTRKRE